MSEKRKSGKKRYFAQQAKKARFAGGQQDASSANNGCAPLSWKLEPGLRGFLITCNRNEPQAKREAYSLLNEYADKLYGSEYETSLGRTTAKAAEFIHEDDQTSNDQQTIAKGESKANPSSGGDKDDDIEAELAKECQFLRNESASNSNDPAMPSSESMDALKSKPERRFTAIDSGCANILFIKTTLADPQSFAHHIFADLIARQERKTRFMLRFLPVQATCKAQMKDIEVALKQLLDDASLKASADFTFAIQRKTRNNAGFERDEVIPALADVIRTKFPLSRVDLDKPELTFVVDVMKTVCCLAILRDYHRFKKYNIQEIVPALDKAKEDNNTKQEEKSIGCEGNNNPTVSKSESAGLSEEVAG